MMSYLPSRRSAKACSELWICRYVTLRFWVAKNPWSWAASIAAFLPKNPTLNVAGSMDTGFMSYPAMAGEHRMMSAAVHLELESRSAIGGVAYAHRAESGAVGEGQRRTGFGGGRHRGLRLGRRRVDPGERHANAHLALHAEEGVRRRQRILAMAREGALVERLPRSVSRLCFHARTHVGIRSERELEAIDRRCPAAQQIDALPRSVGALALAHRGQREANVRRRSGPHGNERDGGGSRHGLRRAEKRMANHDCNSLDSAKVRSSSARSSKAGSVVPDSGCVEAISRARNSRSERVSPAISCSAVVRCASSKIRPSPGGACSSPASVRERTRCASSARAAALIRLRRASGKNSRKCPISRSSVRSAASAALSASHGASREATRNPRRSSRGQRLASRNSPRHQSTTMPVPAATQSRISAAPPAQAPPQAPAITRKISIETR